MNNFSVKREARRSKCLGFPYKVLSCMFLCLSGFRSIAIARPINGNYYEIYESDAYVVVKDGIFFQPYHTNESSLIELPSSKFQEINPEVIQDLTNGQLFCNSSMKSINGAQPSSMDYPATWYRCTTKRWLKQSR